MNIMTKYISDFELTTLVRPSPQAGEDGRWEPLWMKGRDDSGLAIFVSALDAEIYRQAEIAAGGDREWRRVPLAHVDLLDQVAVQGGMLVCQMIFGFSAASPGNLATRGGSPRTRLVPMAFDVAINPASSATFSFDGWVFDYIREQWAIVGAKQHADRIESINRESDAYLVNTADNALNCITRVDAPGQPRAWCVYSPDAGGWLFGPDQVHPPGRLH
jgi:hypothetical protein